MDWIIILVRIAITLTFLILAAGGPYAIWQLRRFISRNGVAIGKLESRVAALERAQKSTSEEPS